MAQVYELTVQSKRGRERQISNREKAVKEEVKSGCLGF